MPPLSEGNAEPDASQEPDAETLPLRRVAVFGGLAQGAFWLFFASYVTSHANPLGDGMELVAMVPETFILIGLVAPGLLLGLIGRWLVLGVVLVGAGAIFNVLLFIQIARELAGRGS